MRSLPILTTFLLTMSLTGTALAGGAKLVCSQASKCSAGVVAQVRAAADAACPCDAASSTKAYAKCWKPVVKSLKQTIGPKACQKEVSRVLAASTCGRSGFVLCKKKGGSAC